MAIQKLSNKEFSAVNPNQNSLHWQECGLNSSTSQFILSRHFVDKCTSQGLNPSTCPGLSLITEIV